LIVPKKGDFIRHVNNMDVCYHVRAPTIFTNDQSMVLRTEIWNMGFTRSWPLNMRHEIKIRPYQRDQFEICDQSIPLECLRKNPWKNMGPAILAENTLQTP
jgi:hypothetical protein